jgi:hypothetical protein
VTRPAAPAEIAALTADLDIEAADVIVLQSKNSADALISQGWGGVADEYDIGHYFGDCEAAESLLGRPLTAAETRALEGCIRHYLRTGETS